MIDRKKLKIRANREKLKKELLELEERREELTYEHIETKALLEILTDELLLIQEEHDLISIQLEETGTTLVLNNNNYLQKT